jgi:hypothetical protein
MELLEVLITLHTSQTVTVAGATTGTVSVPTTADTIAESMRLYYCLERLRLLEQSMIMRLNCSRSLLLRLLKEVLLCLNSASNPSAIAVTTFTFTNGTAGSADYTTSQTVTVPAGATTGTVSVQQLLILLQNQ